VREAGGLEAERGPASSSEELEHAHQSPPSPMW